LWQTQVFSDKFCVALMHEVQNLAKSVKTDTSHGSLSKVGFHILNGFGFESFFAEVTRRLTESFLKPHHPFMTLRCIDAFVVQYGPDDKGHPAHADASDITLNVCLGEKFKGGELCIARDTAFVHRVLRALPTIADVSGPVTVGSSRTHAAALSKRAPDFLYAASPQHRGVAFLHPGPAMHATHAVTVGLRLNLVVWFALEWAQGPATSHTLLSLPDELLEEVLGWLPGTAVAAAGRACRRLHALSEAESVWLRIAQHDPAGPPPPPPQVQPAMVFPYGHAMMQPKGYMRDVAPVVPTPYQGFCRAKQEWISSHSYGMRQRQQQAALSRPRFLSKMPMEMMAEHRARAFNPFAVSDAAPKQPTIAGLPHLFPPLTPAAELGAHEAAMRLLGEYERATGTKLPRVPLGYY
jgi:hypothetical protein